MSYEVILWLHVLVMGYWIGSDLVVNALTHYVARGSSLPPLERKRLWDSMLTNRAILDPKLDTEDLAYEFELAGGHIKNAVLRAAYRAAATHQKISLDLFEDAAKRECQAAGKLFRAVRRKDSDHW